MKCGKLLLVFWLFCLSFAPCLVFAQDAPASSQSLSIQEIFNASKASLNIIEGNSTASNQIINDLQNEVSKWRGETLMWQNELTRQQESSKASEQVLLTKFQNSENTLQSLSASFLTLTQEGKEKDDKILRLTETNAAQAQTIIVMGAVIAAVLAYLIVKLVLWIKGGAAASLMKKLLKAGG
jgi:hypothetical protein